MQVKGFVMRPVPTGKRRRPAWVADPSRVVCQWLERIRVREDVFTADALQHSDGPGLG